jgi:hypothetical protein
MATIEARGPYQFRAKVRRNGVVQTKTFEARRAAVDHAASFSACRFQFQGKSSGSRLTG